MLELTLLEESVAILQLAADRAVPPEVMALPFYSMTRTADELSLVIPEAALSGAALIEVADAARVDRDWSCIKVQGPLDFALTGILAGIAGVLAQAQISLFAVSTYDTDYILVKSAVVERARTALLETGYRFV